MATLERPLIGMGIHVLSEDPLRGEALGTMATLVRLVRLGRVRVDHVDLEPGARAERLSALLALDDAPVALRANVRLQNRLRREPRVAPLALVRVLVMRADVEVLAAEGVEHPRAVRAREGAGVRVVDEGAVGLEASHVVVALPAYVARVLLPALHSKRKEKTSS